MTGMEETAVRGGGHWRLLGWGGAVALLALPFVAMQFTREVDWTLSDFVLFGAMLGVVGLGIEFLVRQSGQLSYRVAAALAMVTAFLLVWMNLAVGIIGSENNDANMMFAAVLATACGGSLIVHFKPRGMSNAMLATAAVQLAVGIIALAMDLGTDGKAWPRDVIVLTGGYAGLWLLAAGLFGIAARRG